MNVLMISPFFRPNVGGVETHLDDLCAYLVKHGHRVSVITYQPLTTKVLAPGVERNHNLEIRRIGWLGYNWFNKLEPYPLFELLYLFPSLCLYSFLFALSRESEIDVVHTHGLTASLVGKLLRPVLKKRFVATVHTIYFLRTRPLLGRVFAWILKSYDKVLFVAEGIREEFLCFGIDKRRTAVFTYWADRCRFRPLEKEACRTILGSVNKFLVLFVGRLIREKGADVLVETARRVTKDVLFAFVTSGSRREFLAMVGANPPENVIYIGPVKYSNLHFYYNAADIFVLPSQHREGFSKAVLEAALCGTPVIASKVGCLPELVNSSIGELVEPPTPERFADRIQYYYKNQGRLKEISSICAEYAQRTFTEDNAAIIERSYYS